MATIAILQGRLTRSRELLAGQLQAALDSRVVIEQARGVLTAPGRMGMSATFDLLRSTARRSNRRLAEVAADVVAGWDTSTSSEPGRQGSDRGLATRVV